MDGPSTDLFSKKQITTVNAFTLSEHFSILGRDCLSSSSTIDDKVLIKQRC